MHLIQKKCNGTAIYAVNLTMFTTIKTHAMGFSSEEQADNYLADMKEANKKFSFDVSEFKTVEAVK